MKSERGELVRGSDPPVVYNVHTTAGDVWRAPTRLPSKYMAAGEWTTEAKLSIVSQPAKDRILSGFDGRPQDSIRNLPRPRAWINTNSSALLPTLM